ncbi:MAG: hypothetical protein UY50_C0017G0009 [Parcubacteria group bacterium GW2011_GWA2_49_9]|nr:MAG: hypothetical protein UY50_C0017G0009 [Parcubacteria group bacterium GW2011_GWA2_49_9]
MFLRKRQRTVELGTLLALTTVGWIGAIVSAILVIVRLVRDIDPFGDFLCMLIFTGIALVCQPLYRLLR